MIFKIKYLDFEKQEIEVINIEAESWNGCLLEFKKIMDINKLLEIKKIEP
jgi:hypothetical protein